MDHIAIMKKSWGLTGKIISGKKTVEARWYKAKSLPWGRIKKEDVIYFKDSGKPVSLKAKVTKVLQFDKLNPKITEKILKRYGKDDLGANDIMPEIRKYVSGKNYCILVFFNEVKRVGPFNINKTGFGAMSAWITVNNIKQIID